MTLTLILILIFFGVRTIMKASPDDKSAGIDLSGQGRE
jgi:hypothetical protein